MYHKIDNMYVLFNIKNCINVQNDHLHNGDPDHKHDVQLPNCINVDPNDLLSNPLSAATFSYLSLNISSLKKHFQTLETEITDDFRSSVIGRLKPRLIQIFNNHITLQVIT